MQALAFVVQEFVNAPTTHRSVPPSVRFGNVRDLISNGFPMDFPWLCRGADRYRRVVLIARRRAQAMQILVAPRVQSLHYPIRAVGAVGGWPHCDCKFPVQAWRAGGAGRTE